METWIRAFGSPILVIDYCAPVTRVTLFNLSLLAARTFRSRVSLWLQTGFVTAILCNIQQSLEHEIPRRSFLSRRAIDGTRGRKYFNPNEDGAFDSYGSAGGQYDPYDHVTDLSDIRRNVPGEPGIDYPAYTTLPQTRFTCEGRSRGYYADEAAGCQVFHVCHDVLVSSFLCPIGSTFSQKLLTCDWWTKVDCASTSRYLEVNHNNYQVDDDEMIRNAYAMISLQSSAEDVTKDGLVDPDSGARIIDYSALGGRTMMGSTPGFRRITDYPTIDATGNDLPSGFEDYFHQNDQQILDYDRYPQRKINPTYQGKLHLDNKERSPYHASLIIQHNYQDRLGNNEFQNDYHRPDGLTNRLQTSYAPTVPTVTTTTRRFYSPTVPTTYRPSTLAYSKLDLMVDGSDHLYAHSKSPVTPPTITHQNGDVGNIDMRESETRYGGLKKSEIKEDDEKDDAIRFKNDDEVHLNFKESSETTLRINMTDAINEDEVFRQQNDRPIIKNDYEESMEDIEMKDSIGIARSLNNPSDGISIQNQNPVEQMSKNERSDLSIPIPTQTNPSYSTESYGKADDADLSQTLEKLNILNETSNDRSTEDYKDIASPTTKSFEEITYTRSFGDRTTPLLRNWHQQKDVDAMQTSTISVTAKPAINTTGRNVDEIHVQLNHSSSSNDSWTTVDQNSSSTKSVSSFKDNFVSRINLSFEVPQPSQFLEPPAKNFLINVPEEPRYTTINKSSTTPWNSETTTEISRFFNIPVGNNQDQSPIYKENVEEQPLIDYADEDLVETPNLEVHTEMSTEVFTPIPLLLSSWHDQSIVDIPATDIVPPVVDYNDGFGDFVLPNEHSHTAQVDHTEREDSHKTQNSPTIPKRNNSKENIQYDTGLHFSIRDAIKTQMEPKIASKLPCYSLTSDEERKLCETSSVTTNIAISTPTTRIPEQRISSGSTGLSEKLVTSVPNEFSTSTTQSSITINSNIDTEELALKTVTPRNVLQIQDPEEQTEKTVYVTESTMLHSIRPGSLKQIEKAIDKHNSPYEVSFTVKKNEDLETTADDFITRLIAQHQPASTREDELDDFEIIKSVEPEDEVASISQLPKFPDTSHASPINSSFLIAVNDTANQSKLSESNVSMLSLLQLMAELLKLDRLPRPFSAKDLRSIELKDSFNLDFDEPNSKASTFDTLKTANIAKPKTSFNLDLDNPSFVTTNPLLDNSEIRTPFKNANTKTLNLDALKIPTNVAESSFVTARPLLDHSQAKISFGNTDYKISSFDDISKTYTNVAFKPSPDVTSRVKLNNTTEQKTNQSKSKSRAIQSLQKQEILEQLTENFGQPLYLGDSIHKSFTLDLPQVQRSLDFETGLPIIEESKHVTNEAKNKNLASSTVRATTTTTQRTTTTTESVKTIVETEFVPSLGFSFDTNEGREEYVQAILGGLIDEHTNEGGRNESNIAQLTDEAAKNESLRLEQHKNSKDP